MRGIFDIENGEIGRRSLETVEGGNAVGVGVDAITFGLERKGHRGQDIAVIIDESDG